MRPSYVTMLTRAASSAGPARAWALARTSVQAGALSLGARMGYRPLAPLLGIAVLTHDCPERCTFCPLDGRRDDDHAEPTLETWRPLLRDMGQLGVAAVTFTGGEPTLVSALPELVREARGAGILPHLSSSGIALTEPSLAHALVDAGLAGATLSVDAPEPGNLGLGARSIESTLVACRALSEAARGRTLSLVSTTVVRPGHEQEALATLGALLDESEDRHPALRVGLMLEHATDAMAPHPDFAGRAKALETLSETLCRWHARGRPLDHSRAYLRALPGASAAEPQPWPCLAPWTSVLVDRGTQLYGCVPSWLTGGLGLAIRGDLTGCWRSDAARLERERLRTCRTCLWNCHSEVNALLYAPGDLLRRA